MKAGRKPPASEVSKGTSDVDALFGSFEPDGIDTAAAKCIVQALKESTDNVAAEELERCTKPEPIPA